MQIWSQFWSLLCHYVLCRFEPVPLPSVSLGFPQHATGGAGRSSSPEASLAPVSSSPVCAGRDRPLPLAVLLSLFPSPPPPQ